MTRIPSPYRRCTWTVCWTMCVSAFRGHQLLGQLLYGTGDGHEGGGWPHPVRKPPRVSMPVAQYWVPACHLMARAA